MSRKQIAVLAALNAAAGAGVAFAATHQVEPALAAALLQTLLMRITFAVVQKPAEARVRRR